MLRSLKTRRDLLEYTRRALDASGVRPSKRLGQHFLVDPRGVRLFAEALESSFARRFLEVGPGVGSITLAVSEFSELIVAVEIHPRLASFLAELGLENVLVLRGDGVEVASSTLMEAVYSNTPYNISAPLILALARNNHVREAVLGVQLEVAERLLAKPGSESYGRLTAVTQRVFSVEKVGVIPSEYYFPEPEVHGAVVKLVRRKAWSREDDLVEAVARCLFTGRNKKVAKMVRRCFEIELEDLSLGEKRVRELSPEDLEKIALTIEL